MLNTTLLTFEEQLEREGTVTYTNRGVSMLPLLRENRDVMVIEKADGRACRKYDAVLFIRPDVQGRGHYVMHRVLKINKDGTLWIIGDNCLSGENVKPENVIGKLTAVIRNGKKISVADRGYRLYVHLWCDCLPLRFFAIRARGFLGRVKRVLKRIIAGVSAGKGKNNG